MNILNLLDRLISEKYQPMKPGEYHAHYAVAQIMGWYPIPGIKINLCHSPIQEVDFMAGRSNDGVQKGFLIPSLYSRVSAAYFVAFITCSERWLVSLSGKDTDVAVKVRRIPALVIRYCEWRVKQEAKKIAAQLKS